MSTSLVYYLEMNSRSEFNNKFLNSSNEEKLKIAELELQESQIKSFEINKFFYSYVGNAWDWNEKLQWSDEQWQSYSEREELVLWIATYKGTPAGYFELEKQDNGNVQLVYFGLAPKFTGKGLGGFFLSKAIEVAWSWSSTKRVWVHTCTEDHPAALKNYKARGFALYKTEEEENP
jgi:GNAT superfamily N-acetyltransferase